MNGTIESQPSIGNIDHPETFPTVRAKDALWQLTPYMEVRIPDCAHEPLVVSLQRKWQFSCVVAVFDVAYQMWPRWSDGDAARRTCKEGCTPNLFR